jgi:hypothetical protein
VRLGFRVFGGPDRVGMLGGCGCGCSIDGVRYRIFDVLL